MKKLFLFFLVLFLAIGCSDEKPENDLSKENLFGKVKSVETTKYQVIDSLGTIVKDGISRYEPTVLDEYNEFGNLEKTKKYILDNPNRYARVSYTYNEINKLIKEDYYSIDDSLTGEVSYKYDENNNLIEMITNNEYKRFNLKYIYKYDNQNNLIEELFYGDSTYVYKGKELKKYNSKNKITESNQYNSKGNLSYRRFYDRKENLTEKIEYDSLNVRFKRTYKYDDKGNLTEHIKMNDKGEILLKSVYKYKYDKKGNWTEKMYLENENHLKGIYRAGYLSEYIIERKIEYYE